MKIRLTSDIENRYVPNEANYNNEQVFWPSLLSSRVLSHMSMIEKPKVLDIGCAYGDYIRWLHSELDDFCYWAVDIDEPAQTYCRGMYPDKVEEHQKYDLMVSSESRWYTFWQFQMTPAYCTSVLKRQQLD